MKKILLPFFLVLHFSLWSQHDFPGFATYNIANMGFRANTVFSVYQDPLGYLWFCNLGGLERWDGTNLKHYPYDRLNPRAMPESLHSSIIMDKTGKYWISTHSCLSVLDPRLPIDSSVTRISRVTDKSDAPLLQGLTGAPIVSDEIGNLWLAWQNQKGLIYIVPDKMSVGFKTIRSESGREDMVVLKTQPDSTGHRMWLVSANNGFCSMGTKDFKVEYYESDLKRELMRIWQESDDILLRTTFFWSKQGFFWCVSNNKPFAQYDVNTRNATLFDCQNPIYTGQPHQEEEHYHEDYRGNFWFSVANNGVLFLDMATRKYSALNTNTSSIAGNLVSSITGDRQGNVWIAHRNAGASKFNYNLKHTKWTRPFGPPPPDIRHLHNVIYLETDPAGNEYLQAYCGFFIKPVGQDSFVKVGNFTGLEQYFSSTDGTRHVVAEDGIYKFSGNPPAYHKLPIQPDDEADSLLKTGSSLLYDDMDGEPLLWMTHVGKGLFRYFINKGTSELVNKDTLIYGADPKTISSRIDRDSKNNLWLLLQQGFARFNLNTQEWKKWIYDPEDINFMAVPPLNGMMVDSKDRVWFSSIEGGAIWFDGEQFHNASRKVPGVIPRCYTVAERKNGEIWFANNKNVVSFMPETGKYKIYNKHGGIQLIAFKDDSTAILASFEPIIYAPIETSGSKKSQPNTVISELKIFENDRSELLYLSEIVLPHDQNYLTFTFGSLDFVSMDAGRFTWKLEGADKDWVEPTDSRSFASYSTLPPGNYTFYVKSCTADGIWDEKGASLKVKILPAWWQTWWFKGMYTLAALALIGWLFHQNTLRKLTAQRAEIEQQQALERERERIARDMHDDLGSGLSAIHLLSNFAKDKAQDPAIRGEMEKIAASSANLNQNIREIIWTVNSADDSLSSLAHFLRRYCADFQENTRLAVHFDAPFVLPEITLTGQVRRNLFLCVKEALNNAAKFAKAAKLEVKLASNDNRISITVRDDGDGFDIENALQNGGNGLRNMQHRMKEIGGTADIESLKGMTELRFELKV